MMKLNPIPRHAKPLSLALIACQCLVSAGLAQEPSPAAGDPLTNENAAVELRRQLDLPADELAAYGRRKAAEARARLLFGRLRVKLTAEERNLEAYRIGMLDEASQLRTTREALRKECEQKVEQIRTQPANTPEISRRQMAETYRHYVPELEQLKLAEQAAQAEAERTTQRLEAIRQSQNLIALQEELNSKRRQTGRLPGSPAEAPSLMAEYEKIQQQALAQDESELPGDSFLPLPAELGQNLEQDSSLTPEELEDLEQRLRDAE